VVSCLAGFYGYEPSAGLDGIGLDVIVPVPLQIRAGGKGGTIKGAKTCEGTESFNGTLPGTNRFREGKMKKQRRKREKINNGAMGKQRKDWVLPFLRIKALADKKNSF